MPSLKQLRDRSTWRTRIVGGTFGSSIRKVRSCPVCFEDYIAQEEEEIPAEELKEYKEKMRKYPWS